MSDNTHDDDVLFFAFMSAVSSTTLITLVAERRNETQTYVGLEENTDG